MMTMSKALPWGQVIFLVAMLVAGFHGEQLQDLTITLACGFALVACSLGVMTERMLKSKSGGSAET